jgi:hypothetical protein
MRTNAALYTQDFYAWTQEQAACLAARDVDALDFEHLVEEMTSLGVSERRALGSHLKQLMLHLLKWQYQPSGRQEGHSWRSSMHNARDEIEAIVEYSPSLRREVPALLVRWYPAARRLASAETGLPLATFPEACPWPAEQVLNADFWPDATP